MSILSGLLGPALTVATNAVGTYEGAQANAAKSDAAAALQRAQLVRQQQQDQIQRAIQDRESQSQAIVDKLHQAQIGEAESQAAQRAYALAHPKPNYAAPVIGPNGEVQLINQDDPMHPVVVPGVRGQPTYHAPEHDTYSAVQGVDADGKPIINVMNTHTGQIKPSGALGKPTGGAGGAQGEVNKARIAAAGAQIANADDSMTKFEDEVKAGRQRLDALSLELASKAMKDDTGSQVAYSALVRQNPRLAEYVRSAKEASTAERMITPRGGSNALMSAEKILMSAGAGGDPILIDQARRYRKTLRHALPTDAGSNAHVPAQSAPTGSGGGLFDDL